jgi:transcriptional regulator with XRE-family HTH domain
MWALRVRGEAAAEATMVDGGRKKTAKKKAAKGGAKGGKKGRKKGGAKAAKRKAAAKPAPESLFARATDFAEAVTSDIATGAWKLATRAGAVPLQVFFGEPSNPTMAREAGEYLRELRELAGLTRDELAAALELSDESLLKAVENGTSTLSFELILRLSAILARHDPIPFIARFTRTYSPEVWRVLEGWGVGRLPLHFEREREFINIYRRHDAARKLTDEGFSKVRDFTRAAFELSLHFVAELEGAEDSDPLEDDEPDDDASEASRRAR